MLSDETASFAHFFWFSLDLYLYKLTYFVWNFFPHNIFFVLCQKIYVGE